MTVRVFFVKTSPLVGVESPPGLVVVHLGGLQDAIGWIVVGCCLSKLIQKGFWKANEKEHTGYCNFKKSEETFLKGIYVE